MTAGGGGGKRGDPGASKAKGGAKGRAASRNCGAQPGGGEGLALGSEGASGTGIVDPLCASRAREAESGDPLSAHRIGTGRTRASSAGSRAAGALRRRGEECRPAPLGTASRSPGRGWGGASQAAPGRSGRGQSAALDRWRRSVAGSASLQLQTTPAPIGLPCRPTLAAAGGAEPRESESTRAAARLFPS